MTEQLKEVTIEYIGKQLDPTPQNMSLSQAAVFATAALPFAVTLEPGDGTHYQFLIVPAWNNVIYNHFDHWGVPANSADDYFIVTKMDSECMTTVWVPIFAVYPQLSHLDPISHNEHTNHVMAWWMHHLVKTMKEL